MRPTAIAATACTIGAAFVFVCFVLTSPAAHGAQGCTIAKLNGRYVFSGQGINLHTGALNFDDNGKFLGKQTSIRSTPLHQREMLSGAYTLDADCAGSMVMEGQLGGTAHWDIFVTEDGKKGRWSAPMPVHRACARSSDKVAGS